MAITNAQQYKQLLAKGGRTGFFIGGNFSTESTKDSQKSTSKGSTGTKYSGGDNNYNYRGPADLGVTTRTKDKVKAPEAYEIIEGNRYDVTGDTGRDNKEERRILNEIKKDKKEKIKDTFVTTDNTPDYLPGYVKFLAGLNNTPNRRYFYDKVVAAGKYPGLNYGMTAQELEEEYEKYMDNRMAGKTDAMGNPTQGFSYNNDGMLTGNFIDSGGDNNYVPPIIPEDDTTEEDPTVPRNLGGLAPMIIGSRFNFDNLADGGRAGAMDGGRMMMMANQEEDDPTGGIMDLESGRQMYFLGKLVKKASRAVKKIVKSPVGKAALMYFGGNALMNAGGGKGLSSFFGKGSFSPFKAMLDAGTPDAGFGPSAFGRLLGKTFVNQTSGALTGLGKTAAIGLPSIIAGLTTPKEEDDDSAYEKYMKEMRLDIPALRGRRNLAAAFDGSTYNYEAYADGGRTGYQEGSEEPVAKKTMPLLDMDGQEMDLREDGGFVPLGRMERADDVPARLSKNEFVFTADAVRNAGEGDIDKGAEVMYNMMKNLESGGEVSEESQGLDGAREMFKTSQRLEEVL